MEEKVRYEWVDQLRGIGIFSVIYGHNFPFLEHYIYSYHIPLFFVIAGMFHPKTIHQKAILHRAKSILAPYFIWSLLLYTFWLVLGRHYGNSATLNLDPINGLVGVFYAQGDIAYMDWGIPMWFLPCIFLSFLLFSIVQKIQHKVLRISFWLLCIVFGFTYPMYSNFHLPWSIDVACVSLLFYGLGFYFKNKIHHLKKNTKVYIVLIFAFIVSVTAGMLNSKIDMYRSEYGNLFLFIISAFSGVLCFTLLVKQIKFHKFLSFLGRNTIPLLALQLRALTVIKLGLMVVGITMFKFSEPTKLLLTCVQIAMLYPILILINKYVPILNGKVKK